MRPARENLRTVLVTAEDQAPIVRAHQHASVCEGTGGIERAVVAALQKEGVAVSVHNGGRVRAFAQARGRLAKTDALDAAVLIDFGAAMQPEGDTPPSEAEAALAALASQREPRSPLEQIRRA